MISCRNIKMIKKKNVLIIILIGILCAYGILGLSENSFAQPLAGKCGDAICDDFEKGASGCLPC